MVELVDTADLKSADAETRRAGSTPALGTKKARSIRRSPAFRTLMGQGH